MKKYGFTKEERSSFPYWFAHWCAFQMVALNCHRWKFKYLFHDIYKPWLRLFMSYDKVQMFHNKHSNHHLLYVFVNGMKKVDWEAMIIDWECSRFTKHAAQLNAKDEAERIISTFRSFDMSNKTVRQLDKLGMLPDKNDMADFLERGWYNFMVDRIEEHLKEKIEKLNL